MAKRLISESPVPPGTNSLEIALWLSNIIPQIVSTIELLQEGAIEERHVAPKKPRTGMVVLADGTDWDPGSGRGVYVYDEDISAWRFLG